MNHDYHHDRDQMVKLIASRGVQDQLLLKAMGSVERHRFFPESTLRGVNPYGDHPCAIGEGQTISQPYIIAYMIEKLGLSRGDKVLEIGTGSGYQTAVLAWMGMLVYTIEIVHSLYVHSSKLLGDAAHLLEGDGYRGWEDRAPFKGIILSCAPETIPDGLCDQLADGGRMILPVGKYFQRLVIVERQDNDFQYYEDLPVRFVPMTGSP